jgi:hypothetical protein
MAGLALVGVVLVIGTPGGAWAQAEPNSGALAFTDNRDVPVGEGFRDILAEAHAAAQQPGAGQDSGFLDFFRKTELSGFADMYVTYSFNEPETGSVVPLGVFNGQHNQFSFALAELALSKPATSDDRVGFRLDLDFGPAADIVNSFEPEGSVFRNVQQGYLSYLAPIGSGLTFDIGRYVTQHGAEVIESMGNWNYSRSIMFGFAIPFYHQGIRATYAVNDRFSFGGTISNGWNNSTDNNSKKTYSVMATISPMPAVTILQNYMGGPEGGTDDWRHLYDGTVSYAVNDTLSVMANYDYGHDKVEGLDVSWQGVALYAKAQATPVFAIVPRFEYYDDTDGFTTGMGQKLKEFTLTAEVKHGQGLLMRLEYRGDWSDQDFCVKKGSPKDNQHAFTVGWVYGFSTRP